MLAICLLEWPSAISWTISRSRGVRMDWDRLGLSEERLEQGFGDFGCEERLVGGKRLNRFEQVTLGIGLQEEAAGSRPEEFVDQRFAVVHREDENFGPWKTPANLARHLDAVDQRQRVVDHRDVGLRFHRFDDGLLAVCGLGHDLPIGLSFEDAAESGADDLMVVGNQDAGHGRAEET